MKILAAMLLSVIMLSSGFMINSPATAAPNENANDNAKHSFKLPEGSVEIAPGVFHIGTAIHEGQVVDGLAIFHHRPGHDGGPGSGGPGGGPGGNGEDVKCFDFIVQGIKWKTVEPYLVDTTNTEGLDGQDIKDNIAAAITVWEDSANFDILGNLGAGTGNGIDEISPDGQNEVVFGDIASGAVGVTIFWYLDKGPNRGAVEWDMLFNQDDFNWSIAPGGVAAKYDFLSVAAHEVGHATGMAHPDDVCVDETMYRFVDTAKIKKRDLNSGDIAGIQKLY